MEGPGLSLFQGSESIQLNANTQGLEEDEEQEDIKRRNEEIGDLLTSAFADLENDDEDDDDDVSSINSTKENDHSSTLELRSSSKAQATNQLTEEFGIYDHVDSSANYSPNTMTNHKADSHSGMNTECSIYVPSGNLHNKNNRPNQLDNAADETSYELAQLPNSIFPGDTGNIEESYTFNDNYPYNYETPANHYNSQIKQYSNNGYINDYGHQCKEVHEFGGGDNVNSEDHNHCFKSSTNGRIMDEDMAYKNAEYNSKEQLEVLYTIRMKEIKRLTEELQQLQHKKEEEKEQFNRKLVLLQAEVERSNISRNQAQHALIDAKAEIADLRAQIAALNEKDACLEKANQNMTEELVIAKDSVVDLQQKISVLERVQALQSSDKIHEKFLKQAQEKHAVEIRNMQTQIDVLTEKLNAKEASYVALEHKLSDIRRSHDALMIEKGDTMNKLAQVLEKSQAQCRNLIATNNDQQVLQLQAQIKLLNQEKEEMQKNIQELQNKLELTRHDAAQYDSLLATTLEDESDSIRQLKLGDLNNRSKSKPCDDITNKLRGELQRCLAGQAVKRKEITRLENTLSQKEKELAKTLTIADSCRQEAARYAKRVSELEKELKSLLTDQALKANAQIQKLSTHLNEVRKHCESLKEEKLCLEQKLEESQAINQETLKQLQQESMNVQEKESIEEYNKEYLEIHRKAVERVREEAKVEIVQLTVQLERTQKELDHVKELYIDVCGTKEQLINDHKEEIKALKEKYAALDESRKDMEKLEYELQTQTKISEKLAKECESYKDKVMELETNLNSEKRKREEHMKRIHQEIERAKEEALNELRNAHPNQQISVLLPDHCSEHLQRINQLEGDCARLEEKLQIAIEEHKKMSEYQTELDEVRLKMAQVEISQESWRKKYENIVTERNELFGRISALNSELTSLKKRSQVEDSDDVKLKITRVQIENEALKSRYEILLDEKNTCKNKITQLESELSEAKKIIASFENKFKKNDDIALNSKYELEQELTQYKDLVKQLSNKLHDIDKKHQENEILEQKIKHLESNLRKKDEELQKEKDQLVTKLNDQTKQFEQFIKNQKQVSAELNLSPRTSSEETDLQKIREIMIKEVRKEMEEKVIKELKSIEEHHQEKRSELEEKYKSIVLQLQAKYNEKLQEMEVLRNTVLSEKANIHSSFKAKEQFLNRLIENKLEAYYQELLARKLKIQQLQEELKQKENDVEKERDLMAQVMTSWVAEIKDIKTREANTTKEAEELKKIEESLRSENDALKEKEEEMKASIETLKHKYQAAKKSAINYKEYAKRKENFFLSECKRIEEGYKKAIAQVQRKHDAIVSAYEEKTAIKVTELECQYKERIEQMRTHTPKYKNSC